jgi:hypothetical protein
MATEHLFKALKATVGNSTDKLILIALADSADAESGQCWPSIGYLMARAECSRTTVKASLARLEAKGFISRQARYGEGGRQRSTLYAIGGQIPTGEGSDSDRGRGQNPTTEPTLDRTSLREPTINNDRDEVFEQFWSAYPRKVAKPAARKAWRQVDPSDYPAIAENIRQRLELRQWRPESDKRFIPHPATYLNQRRWQDDVEDCRTPGEKAMTPQRVEANYDDPFMLEDRRNA